MRDEWMQTIPERDQWLTDDQWLVETWFDILYRWRSCRSDGMTDTTWGTHCDMRNVSRKTGLDWTVILVSKLGR